ncbi:hypothetical protein AB0M87_22310 [Streptomyces sp. NPDC051320]|uniref:hypothetical protein n=1 Tax=Streptomyces sp. NPDC051320 TaxID=3154644 RepID=UPI0034303F33
MVRTMSYLRSLIGTARRLRPGPPSPAGLSCDTEVLLDVPDERLGPALVAAANGEYEPAAKLLATTREAAEWEDRDRYTARLAAFTLSREDWLAEWLAAAPYDPDARLLKAELAVLQAWDSPARAERLREVGPLIDAAADGDPRDPVPWRIALDHARGVHTPHTDFEKLWEQALRRSSRHYGCHVAALQYLSAQWYGSHRECFDFAEQAADDALPSSLIQALPVRAAFAYLISGGRLPVARERIDEAADRAIALSASFGPGNTWQAEIRNLLVYVLVSRERWAEAVEQFRLIGPDVTSFPWAQLSDDPLGRFLELRYAALRSADSGRGPRGRPERSRVNGHYA